GLAKEVAPVTVDGVRADMLASDVAALMKTKPSPSVQLLPLFDPYLMGHESRDHLFERIHRPKVSRTAGWISAVVLADGRVVGTWTHATRKETLRVTVAPFARLPSKIRSEIELRAGSIAEALGLSDAKVEQVRL
ncbi:MAG: crosslink repair DNA glycosylase YcaQ family protein, partial [Chloroflexota bacterium]